MTAENQNQYLIAFPLHHQDFSEADTVDMDALSVTHKTVSAPASARNMVLELALALHKYAPSPQLVEIRMACSRRVRISPQ
jgi:hypothetical protein